MAKAPEINVLALVRGRERYVFLYDDASCKEVVLAMGRFASDPELSFTWRDAARLSREVVERSREWRSSSLGLIEEGE